jgi:hypothetical protein
MSDSRPIHEIRMGRIKAAIWLNETQNGRMHNVTIQRLYMSDDGWAATTSFGREDLPLVGKVADLAHTWIYSQAAAGNGAAKGGANAGKARNASEEIPF